MVLDTFFPPDIRVEKEARTLLEAGHEIYLLCPARKGTPNEELLDGIWVIRKELPWFFSGRAWIYLGLQVFAVHPFWKKIMEATVKEHRIEAIHVHDLPLVKTGLCVARSFGIHLIADLHENYPEAIRTWATTWIAGLVVPIMIKRWKQIERYSVQEADRVITVVDEAKEHYITDCEIPKEKVTVVMNVTDIEYFCSIPIQKEIIQRYETYFTICYIGGFGRHRGLHTAILAMPQILQRIPNARLVLVGSAVNGPELLRMSREQNVIKEVEFTGWQPFELVPSYIAASNVCLIPHISSGHTQSTIPHKIFQAMAMGRPVVVSSVKPLERIVNETGAGLVYPSGDAQALAEAVIAIHKDNKLAIRLGHAGELATKRKYNWKVEANKLVALYEGLENSGI